MIVWKMVLVPGVFLALLIGEHAFPLRERRRRWASRMAVNQAPSVGPTEMLP